MHTGNSDPKAIRLLAKPHILPDNCEEWHNYGRLQRTTPPVTKLQTCIKLNVM